MNTTALRIVQHILLGLGILFFLQSDASGNAFWWSVFGGFTLAGSNSVAYLLGKIDRLGTVLGIVDHIANHYKEQHKLPRQAFEDEDEENFRQFSSALTYHALTALSITLKK